MAKIKSAEEQHEIMMTTPIPKLVTMLSIPTVLNQLITVIYSTADTWFVSKIGTSASAAAGVVFSIMAIIQAFGFGIAMGSGNLISIRLGEKRNKEAEAIASSGFIFAVILGLIVSVLGLTFLKPLMFIIGSTESMLKYSCDYARFIFISAPVMCASCVLGNIMRSEGEPGYAAFGLCIGGVINVILDPILIFKLNLGISGASMATALSQLISFIILAVGFLNGKSIVKIKLKSISRDIHTYLEIITTGMPTICRQSLGSVASALLNRCARIYGDAAVAAITIATKVYVLIRNIVIGIGQGYQPAAGYNFGAGNKKRTRQSFVFAAVLSTVVCVLFTALIYGNAPAVIKWFRDDPEVMIQGERMLRFFCFAVPALGYSTLVNQLYQCLGFKKPATFLASCRQGIFFVPALYILSYNFGLVGIELTQTVSDILLFVISIPFQIYFFKKHLSE